MDNLWLMVNSYPLVNINKKRWKITFFLMGKSTINGGKRSHNELENHDCLNGKIHYFDWVIFNSKL